MNENQVERLPRGEHELVADAVDRLILDTAAPEPPEPPEPTWSYWTGRLSYALQWTLDHPDDEVGVRTSLATLAEYAAAVAAWETRHG